MAKSKRSKHMRAMRKILREKLSKKDEAKRLALMKKDNLIPSRVSTKDTSATEIMDVTANANTKLEYNLRTLQNKDGQYPSWLSGRQRKRLQAKKAVVKRNEKQKKLKTGKNKKRNVKQNNDKADTSDAMLT